MSESENNESGCGWRNVIRRYSHERLVARANLLDENVVFGIEVWLDAAVRALRIQHWTAQ